MHGQQLIILIKKQYNDILITDILTYFINRYRFRRSTVYNNNNRNLYYLTVIGYELGTYNTYRTSAYVVKQTKYDVIIRGTYFGRTLLDNLKIFSFTHYQSICIQFRLNQCCYNDKIKSKAFIIIRQVHSNKLQFIE